jgi:paraquat-inducible protein B
MSGASTPPRATAPAATAPGATPPGATPPVAKVRRSRFSLVWLIPLVALVIAGYLGLRTVQSEGPLITITWKTGDGLVAGQTKVQHKAVALGQVESVRLSEDLQSVSATVRMRREAVPYLTDQARFWVVRPRLSSGSISGIETLVSGSYIEMDPGSRDGKAQTQFTGLESPPGVRTGEPGKTFELRANRLGSLSAGAPVFWRDITVGEVLGYDIGSGDGPVTVSVFVRAPYDDFVREGTHFWNASGLSVSIGADGVHVEVASLQAVLSGGVAFDTSHQQDAKKLPAGTQFELFKDYQEAQAAGYKTRQPFVTYFESDVSGLAKGSAVDFFGQQIGTVTDVGLDFDPNSARARVRVLFEIQPERVDADSKTPADPVEVARRLVARGMRAQLQTSSYLTGAKVLALGLQPDAAKAEMTKEGNLYVIPSIGGGLDSILNTVSDITAKINRLPLDEIGANLNGTLKSASTALVSVNELVRKTDNGLSPVLSRLPALMASLQDAVAKTGRTLGSIDQGYGKDSQFNRDLERAMAQVGDTARSIRLLADYLDRHPEALIRGRADYGVTR